MSRSPLCKIPKYQVYQIPMCSVPNRTRISRERSKQAYRHTAIQTKEDRKGVSSMSSTKYTKYRCAKYNKSIPRERSIEAYGQEKIERVCQVCQIEQGFQEKGESRITNQDSRIKNTEHRRHRQHRQDR